MSGGTDSGAVAWLLKQQGWDVTGVHFLMYSDQPSQACINVCEFLDIPLRIVDVRERFRQEVIAHFESMYMSGLTPNPCALCNPAVKFRVLFEQAGEGAVATGHYVRLDTTGKEVILRRGVDTVKDQSYFLALVPPELLSSCLFPLGTMVKPDVKKLVADAGIPVEKSESQDVCFLANGNYREFLDNRQSSVVRTGNMMQHVDGRILGTHDGVHHFTIGQHKHLGLGGGPEKLYVTAILPDATVVVGPRDALWASTVTATHLNWITAPPRKGEEVSIKIRYRQETHGATITAISDTELSLRTHQPVSAVTPGQVLALYRGDILAGGGIILGT